MGLGDLFTISKYMSTHPGIPLELPTEKHHTVNSTYRLEKMCGPGMCVLNETSIADNATGLSYSTFIS